MLSDPDGVRRAVTNARKALDTAKRFLPTLKNVGMGKMGDLGRGINELESAVKEFDQRNAVAPAPLRLIRKAPGEPSWANIGDVVWLLWRAPSRKSSSPVILRTAGVRSIWRRTPVKGALIAWLVPSLQVSPCLFGCEPGVNRTVGCSSVNRIRSRAFLESSCQG